MAGDWIKMKSDLRDDIKTISIANAVNKSRDETLAILYRLACWFRVHGKYGRIPEKFDVIDMLFNSPGLSAALKKHGWLKQDGGNLMLSGFCDVSTIRKSLGSKIRKRILSVESCWICGSGGKLVIDHKTPVCRGGTEEEDNLHAICEDCNRRKGRKTLEEFLNDR
jgi:hypothetical protein